MKVAIFGTRGIPNYHGGFEQFAEYFTVYLASKGHEVSVYNSHTHPYQKTEYKGVKIIHRNDPEHKIGTVGQFVYDFNSILHIRRSKFDVVLQLGYTSSSIWSFLFPKGQMVVTNMDGLEWKRSKYSSATRKFLRFAERLAVKHSHYLVADSLGIQEYLQESYGAPSEYIPYGAEIFESPQQEILSIYEVIAGEYDLLIARLEPENNIEAILDGVAESTISRDFLVIGKHETKFGKYLKAKFASFSQIRFIGGIYNLKHLNNLRYFSNLYFHGHSVGGTNPSLLEAMASNALIVAHNNSFNKSILGPDAFYFENSKDISGFLNMSKKDHRIKLRNNATKICDKFKWEQINAHYEWYLKECLVKFSN